MLLCMYIWLLFAGEGGHPAMQLSNARELHAKGRHPVRRAAPATFTSTPAPQHHAKSDMMRGSSSPARLVLRWAPVSLAWPAGLAARSAFAPCAWWAPSVSRAQRPPSALKHARRRRSALRRPLRPQNTRRRRALLPRPGPWWRRGEPSWPAPTTLLRRVFTSFPDSERAGTSRYSKVLTLVRDARGAEFCMKPMAGTGRGSMRRLGLHTGSRRRRVPLLYWHTALPDTLLAASIVCSLDAATDGPSSSPWDAPEA
ncbi:uncharacterized protein BDZ99DRAFT_532773 [Mytilinidion resinicola]|uniref:Uncharacterized protein n=1 Tax=Mytilinidion resinicola TaxID=574789 RepID=A0A6A6YIY5_9PEZI|nr:uncharacterized protein BDZ99DRAFT_532773 [Mytilinidion resinicola]KAF2808761.1 hypothetical protein BDZ99DRAFT_532773 [Mytilinidion resinicola]